VDVVVEGQSVAKPMECVVYTWSMREQRTTRASRLRNGETVSAEIQPWEDVSDALEKFQRSELERPEFLLEPATWAEFLR
jgi:DTW domain-containing protein YfiP